MTKLIDKESVEILATLVLSLFLGLIAIGGGMAVAIWLIRQAFK